MSPSRAARARVALLAGNTLAVLVLAGSGTLSAQGTTPPAPPSSERLETRQATPRPFEHAVHQDLSCRQCHGGGPRHRRGRIWSAADCASCHHDPELGRDCAACHRSADIGPRLATATMALSVWDEPRVRELPFDHARHEQPCSTCHQSGVTLTPRECATCHVEHTSAGVECVACHRPPAPAVHDLTAHLTCTGARCHTGAATERPMLARASCLVCHQEQKEHRPGRECAGCHFLPRNPPAGGPWRVVPSPLAPAPR